MNVIAKGKLRPWDSNLVPRVLENEKTLGTRLNLIGFYDLNLQIKLFSILGDPAAVSRVDKMFVVKAYCKIETNHHEDFIDPTNCPWVSEDGSSLSCLNSKYSVQNVSYLYFRLKCRIKVCNSKGE